MGRPLGQHFLVRQSTLARIARAACPEPQPLVIEIGPGKGALTAHLLPRAARLIAIELDSNLAASLRHRFAAEPKLEIVERDVLETDLAEWGRPVVAGNLPYYITSPIIERTLALASHLERAVFLVQKEVAQRLAASPGTRDYGYLTVRTQFQAQAELLFDVPRGAFQPPPKVDSAVVRLTPRAVDLADPSGFLEFAKLCFRQKRKNLRNNLAPVYGPLDWPEGSLRAEQLSVSELLDLYRRAEAKRTAG